MSNKLVIVCQSAGFLLVDVANEALGRYKCVVLVASGCSFMERPLDSRIRVDKIIRYDKSTAFRRIFTWLAATLQIFHKLLWHYRGYEVMYFTNPPMSYFCSRLLQNRYRVVVWDLYPDALRAVGVGSKNMIWRLWAGMNRKVFAKAERVVTLGGSMKQAVSKYCAAENVTVAPPWSGSSKFFRIEKLDNQFIVRHGLAGKFIVLYSGNIGYTHSVEVLVEVARLLREDKDLLFLIIGQGKKRSEIEQSVFEYGLSNVILMDYQPVDMLPYSLGAADLGVVTLDENVAAVSVPSKTFNLFASGVPILAIADERTEMHHLLTLYGNGRCISKGRTEEMAAFIRQLKGDPALHRGMSDASLRAARDFTFANASLYFK